MQKIISKSFQAELQSEIHETQFSLLTDETTDISVCKLLGVSIKYYSGKMKKVISTFLGILELKKADAITLEGEIRYILTFSRRLEEQINFMKIS